VEIATSTTLLAGLRNPQDQAAWERFSERYRPLVIRFARGLGLSGHDAQDAAQETMAAFFKAYRDGSYDREKGRLRSWLFGIAHRKVIDLRRRRAREVVVTDKSDASAFLGNVESSCEAEQIWEQEWQAAVLRACMDEIRREVKPETFQAFDLYVLRQKPAEEVMAHLGVTRHALHCAKSRILGRLRELQPVIEENW